MGLSSWYTELAGLAMSLVTETEITPELTRQLTSTADTWDGYASSLETAFPDAPASYAAAAAVIKAQATTLRTWSDDHASTKGLAEAMDAATTGAPGEQIQAAITDLESRCAPWTFG